jgi:hypothetical protein
VAKEASGSSQILMFLFRYQLEEIGIAMNFLARPIHPTTGIRDKDFLKKHDGGAMLA